MSQPLEAFRNAFKIPELKSRIIFTLVMLAIYRLGCHVPMPGVDGTALAAKMQELGGGLLGFYDLFTGGAFTNATVFALGIMPYITASIIFSLLIPVIPQLEALQKSGQEGYKKITEWTRYATIVLCIVQSLLVAVYLRSLGPEIVPNDSIGYYLMTILSLTTGTAFIMWAGEQITEHGIGNGISVIIFISIISGMPSAVRSLFTLVSTDQVNVFQGIVLVGLLVAVVMGAIIVTTGQRRIPVQYPRQVKGRRVSGGQRSYVPLRVNHAGVIPIIFASSLLMLPSMLSNSVNVPYVKDILTVMFDHSGIIYNLLYAILIMFFAFFYTAIQFNPVEIADTMKKYGGVIVGVRPGKATADYLNFVMTRITLVGSFFLAGVALLPVLIFNLLRIPDWNLVHFFGGTTLLILVGVALDTIRQIEQHLIMRHYDGFGASGRPIRGRRR